MKPWTKTLMATIFSWCDWRIFMLNVTGVPCNRMLDLDLKSGKYRMKLSHFTSYFQYKCKCIYTDSSLLPFRFCINYRCCGITDQTNLIYIKCILPISNETLFFSRFNNIHTPVRVFIRKSSFISLKQTV